MSNQVRFAGLFLYESVRDSFNNKEKENEPWRNFYLLLSP